MQADTVGALLGRCLRAIGIDRVFGRAVPGLPTVAVPDRVTARLLADADGRLGPATGCAFLADGELRLSSRPGTAVVPTPVASARDLPESIARAAPTGTSFGTGALWLDLDLDAPAPSGLEPVTPPPPGGEVGAVPELEAAAGTVLVLAGPGVVRAGTVSRLREFAARTGLGVANTWGAKGVLAWDSPHHMGTAGLQANDFELLGFNEAALVVTTGVDRDESPPERLAMARLASLAPDQLSQDVADQLPRQPPPAPNRLYERLSAVAQPGYVATRVPLHPARAVSDLRAVVPAGGVVTAQPGLAGLWVARTFPTTEPGSVVVPATTAPGIAVAIALAAATRERPAVAVVDGPLDDTARTLVDHAVRLNCRIVLDVWARDGQLAHADEHRDALRAAVDDRAPGTSVVHTPVAAGDVELLIEAAGDVVAWGGIARPGRS